jgi:hypothetical protein
VKNILITESQLESLMSNISSNKDFFRKVLETYPNSKNILPFIEKVISDSGVGNITIEPLKYGSGVSLPNRVAISTNVLSFPLHIFLFTIFHELAHQLQFKKYGYDKMMELYNDDISVEDGIEIVADEYATRKLRELVKLKLLPNNIVLPTGLYKKTPKQTFIKIVEMVKEMIQGLDYKNSEELGEKLYNALKTQV